MISVTKYKNLFQNCQIPYFRLNRNIERLEFPWGSRFVSLYIVGHEELDPFQVTGYTQDRYLLSSSAELYCEAYIHGKADSASNNLKNIF